MTAERRRPGLVTFAGLVTGGAAVAAGVGALLNVSSPAAGVANGALALGLLWLTIAVLGGRRAAWWVWLIGVLGLALLFTLGTAVSVYALIAGGAGPDIGEALAVNVLCLAAVAALAYAWCRPRVKAFFAPEPPPRAAPRRRAASAPPAAPPRTRVSGRPPPRATTPRPAAAPAAELERLCRRHQYYEVLGLNPSATGAEVLSAIERFRDRWPPGHYRRENEIGAEAWSYLQHVNRRKAYDLARAALQPGSALRRRVSEELDRRGKLLSDADEFCWVVLWEPCYNRAEVEIQSRGRSGGNPSSADRLSRLTDFLSDYVVRRML